MELFGSKTVKNMPYKTGTDEAGKYTGQINDEHIPHGKGFYIFDDGLMFWCKYCFIYDRIIDCEGIGWKLKRLWFL